MTDELQKLLDGMPDISSMLDETPIETSSVGSNRFFGILKLYQIPVIPFQSGEKMTIPGVFEDKWNNETKTFVRNGLKEFKAMRLGKSKENNVLYVLVHERVTSTGQEYQSVKQYHTWQDKDKETKQVRPNLWIKFQHGALKAIPKDMQPKLLPKVGLACSLVEAPTGEKYQDGDIKFYDAIVGYADKSAMKAAEEEHFAQFSKTPGGGNGVDESNFPFTWKGQDGQLLYKMIRDGLAAGKTPMAVAQEVSCLQQPGNKPGVRLDGETPLDLPKLFGKATDQPAEMFTF